MTTTTGDPSTLKSPASLSSGDLVSRLLAATPPYLYNVPLTSHSFFFSEMLRSFVQAKTEAPNLGSVPSSNARRRKKLLKEVGPLELTTSEKRSRHHHHHPYQHHPHQHHQQQDKYLHGLQHTQGQQPASQMESIAESRGKSLDAYDAEGKSGGLVFDQKPLATDSESLKPAEDNYPDFKQTKNYFADRLPQADPQEASLEMQKLNKPDDQERKNVYNERNSEVPFIGAQKNKMDFCTRGFPAGLPANRGEEMQGMKGFVLPGNVQNPDFLPGPLWYPPYPLPQSYPGIDPLHFFIDLRVSGHIWDQKLNSERQLSFKSKHSSAFSVPQSKECNRPLNLTRSEAGTSKSSTENTQGTHYILKHISRTYKDIHEAEKSAKSDGCDVPEEGVKSSEDDSGLKKEETGSTSCQDEERKDIRAIIGLELVVDYVKEPKCDPGHEQPSAVTE